MDINVVTTIQFPKDKVFERDQMPAWQSLCPTSIQSSSSREDEQDECLVNGMPRDGNSCRCQRFH